MNMDADVLDALPADWRAQWAGADIVPVAGGMSGAYVFRICGQGEPARYLKMATGRVASRLVQEIERTEWLAAARIRVPKIIARFAGADVVAAAMSALDGRTAEHIDPRDRRPAAATIARALARLHALPLAGCPFDETLKVRLARARELVRAGEIDPAHFAARNAGVSPEHLYARLEAGVPAHEDRVVVHGDATLSNLILASDGEVGFVDCGHCGRADRYVDLALLAAEFEERFGPGARQAFIDAYGDPPWDQAKAAFYLDLYELF
jgi:aminoglycoside 3'-phosphotransferase-2